MRRQERRSFAGERELLVTRDGGVWLLSRPHAPFFAARRAAWRSPDRALRYGLNRDGRCGSPARNAACAGREHPGVACRSTRGSRARRRRSGCRTPRGSGTSRGSRACRSDVRAEARAPPRAASRRGRAAVRDAAAEQELRDLLRDGGTALDDLPLRDVLATALAIAQRIDSVRGTRTADPRPQASQRPAPAAAPTALESDAPRAVAGQRFVERHTAPIDDDGGCAARQIQKRRIDRPEADPAGGHPAIAKPRPRTRTRFSTFQSSDKPHVHARRTSHVQHVSTFTASLQSWPWPSGRRLPARTSPRRATALCGTFPPSWRGRCRRTRVCLR